MKLATHNSFTGEASSFFSLPLIPFARCQSKTLKEQVQAGSRYFDLRVIFHHGEFYGAHGLWRTKETAVSLIHDLSNAIKTLNASGTRQNFYATLTYERVLSKKNKTRFLEFYNYLRSSYTNIIWGSCYVKYTKHHIKVDWQKIYQGSFTPKTNQAFLPLDGTTWHTFLPIPRLWHKFYKPTFSDSCFNFVDFL